jgi:ABC-2 type transport system permease protein
MIKNISWSMILALIIKELLAVWHDKKSRIALIAPPLIQLLILSHAATLEVKNISMVIYNQDKGIYSHEIIQKIKGSNYFSNIYQVSDAKELQYYIDTQKAIIALGFQSDFSKKTYVNQASIQVIIDGRKSNSGQIVGGYINNIIQDVNEEILTKRGLKNKKPVITIFRSWFNPNLDYIYYNAPSLVAVLSMILTLTITAMSVAREREYGTFDQLLVSPIKPWQILVGKSIPAVIIGVGETTFIMILSIILFNIPFSGSLILFYLSMVVFVLSMIGVGLFISSISLTQQQAHLGIFVFMMPTMLLSGFSTPVDNIISWLKPVSYSMPLTHFLIIVRGVFLKDIGAFNILYHTLPMAIVAIITLSFAGWMFGRKLE